MSTGTDRLTDQVQEIMGQAQERVQDVGASAREQAGQAQDRLREQAETRTRQLGEQVGARAEDLRAVSDALRQQGKHAPADLADRLAGYAERAGGYLTERDAEAMLADAESYGRQHPGTVALGALAVGFAASRFLKASSSRRYSELRRGSVGSATGNGSVTPTARIVEPDTVGAGAIAGAHSDPIPDALEDPLPGMGSGPGTGPGTRPDTGAITDRGGPVHQRPVPGTER